MQSVCFERLAEGMDSEAQISSCLRRIQRFFASFVIDNDCSHYFVFPSASKNQAVGQHRPHQLVSPEARGKTDINVFMLSVCYEGIAFPLLWKMLDKKGNSNQRERIGLIQKFIKLFGKECIESASWRMTGNL